MTVNISSNTKFQLAFNGNSSFCLAVQSANPNALVSLQGTASNSNNNVWIQPQNPGPIYLASTYGSANQLCIDVALPAGNGSNTLNASGSILYLNLAVPNSQTQQWQISGSSPLTITNTGLTASLNNVPYVIDNPHGVAANFNPGQIWQSNGSGFQLWLQLAV